MGRSIVNGGFNGPSIFINILFLIFLSCHVEVPGSTMDKILRWYHGHLDHSKLFKRSNMTKNMPPCGQNANKSNLTLHVLEYNLPICFGVVTMILVRLTKAKVSKHILILSCHQVILCLLEQGIAPPRHKLAFRPHQQ